MLAKLTLDSLGELDNGRVRLAFNHLLNRVMLDLDDRGDDLKSRKLVLTLDASKVSEGKPHIRLSCDVKATIPPLTTGDTIAEIVIDGNVREAHFRPENPDRTDQPSMFTDPDHE